MFYYFVWVRSNRYHGSESLTYQYQDRLKTGSIVQVELQKELVFGVVTGVTSKPRFPTKEIATVLPLPPLPDHLLKVSKWLHEYYPSPLGVLTQQLLPFSFSPKYLELIKPEQQLQIDESRLPPLSNEQAAAVSHMHDQGSFILHGTTGSGKTRVYIELAIETVQSGRSVIILTPEISLTAQLLNNFSQIFGDHVVLLHSQQTLKERQLAWLRCLLSDIPLVVVGPRSALFTPLKKLGLIVMDEAHESAYKQETAPQYQTGRVAACMAAFSRSVFVMGSATPSVSDMYLALQKDRPVLKLSNLAQSSSIVKKSVMIIDRKDRVQFAESQQLSDPLIASIRTSLDAGEQSLLYLNRRGTARLVMCENCGWQANCPHCDVPLIYHSDSHDLRCHSCNYHTHAPSSCPICSFPSVLFMTAGTKAIVEEVMHIFPGYRVGRYDADNRKDERFDVQYNEIRNGSVDILVGTQLLAKGLDLPKLSTLGVILAESSLYVPDFSSQERTYQLVNQVLGRIGRGHVEGRAIIQTYHPDHPVLLAALAGDYDGFYESELLSRKEFLFPPFCYLMKLTVRRATVKSAESAALACKLLIEQQGLKVRVEGPAPSFHERVLHKFQWQLVIKAKDRGELIKVIKVLPANWSYDIDPIDLL